MKQISYKRHRFPPTIIRHAVWLYLRFTPSLQDIEDLLAERGIEVSYEATRTWTQKFALRFARNLGRTRVKPIEQLSGSAESGCSRGGLSMPRERSWICSSKGGGTKRLQRDGWAKCRCIKACAPRRS